MGAFFHRTAGRPKAPMVDTHSKAVQEAHKKPGGGWKGKTRGGYVGNWIFLALIRHVGLWSAYVLLTPVVFYFLFFAPKSAKASYDYLRRIGYGGKSGMTRLVAVYKHLYSFGKTLLDRVAIIWGDTSKFNIELEGESYLRNGIDEGKGLIIISAHFGNWEAAANLLGSFGSPVNVVAYEGEAARIRKLFTRALENKVFTIISLDGSPDVSFQILNALNRGEIVAMHADRLLESSLPRAVQVPFLGRPAYFPVGPHAIAAASGAPLIHTFAMRRKTYCYRFRAYPPQHLSFAGRSERTDQYRKWVELFVHRLEENLIEYPLQWYNFYDFWKGTGGHLA